MRIISGERFVSGGIRVEYDVRKTLDLFGTELFINQTFVSIVYLQRQIKMKLFCYKKNTNGHLVRHQFNLIDCLKKEILNKLASILLLIVNKRF